MVYKKGILLLYYYQNSLIILRFDTQHQSIDILKITISVLIKLLAMVVLCRMLKNQAIHTKLRFTNDWHGIKNIHLSSFCTNITNCDASIIWTCLCIYYLLTSRDVDFNSSLVDPVTFCILTDFGTSSVLTTRLSLWLRKKLRSSNYDYSWSFGSFFRVMHWESPLAVHKNCEQLG